MAVSFAAPPYGRLVVDTRDERHKAKMAAKKAARATMRAQPLYASRTSNGSIATGNRHGGEHQHQREIARRVRQQARLHQNYMLNGGFSRRGNEVGPLTSQAS